MMEETTLAQLLARAAEEIDVPADGAARIRAAAAGLERRSIRTARVPAKAGARDAQAARTVRPGRSRRTAAVAASVVAAGLIALATLELGGSGSTAPPAQAHKAILGPRAAFGAAGASAGASLAPSAHQLSGGAPGTGAAAPRTGPSSSDVAGQKIESTGSMNLTVAHLDPAVSALTTEVSGDGGYVASEQTQSASPGVPASGTVTLEVPETSFSRLVDQVQRLGVASSVSTKQVDVTGQYVDLQAQITALRATQQQYLTIMTRAQSIGDILTVQQQLDSIDSQLQQVEGELNLLDSQTADGTLTIDLSEPGPKPPPGPKPAPKAPTGLAAAWGAARHGFADGVYWVVRQTGGLAFLILLAGLLYLLGRVGWRGLRRLAL